MKTTVDTSRALAISNIRSVQRDRGPKRAPFLFQVGLLGVESKGSKEENVQLSVGERNRVIISEGKSPYLLTLTEDNGRGHSVEFEGLSEHLNQASF